MRGKSRSEVSRKAAIARQVYPRDDLWTVLARRVVKLEGAIDRGWTNGKTDVYPV